MIRVTQPYTWSTSFKTQIIYSRTDCMKLAIIIFLSAVVTGNSSSIKEQTSIFPHFKCMSAFQQSKAGRKPVMTEQWNISDVSDNKSFVMSEPRCSRMRLNSTSVFSTANIHSNWDRPAQYLKLAELVLYCHLLVHVCHSTCQQTGKMISITTPRSLNCKIVFLFFPVSV